MNVQPIARHGRSFNLVTICVISAHLLISAIRFLSLRYCGRHTAEVL